MNNISAKLWSAVFFLFTTLISFSLAASQDEGLIKQPKPPVARTYAKDDRDIHLTCGGSKTLGGVLSKLNPDKEHTIRISGSCTENVDIIGFQHLILIGEAGASINDASLGELATVNVQRTPVFEMQGLTINGGNPAVGCFDNSTCFFQSNTFQGAADGVDVIELSKAEFVDDVIQNNDSGLLIQNSSTVSMAGGSIINNGAGVATGFTSALHLYVSTVQGNEAYGIRINANSFGRFVENTISDNGGDGVLAQRGSVAYFLGGNTVTNNAQAGVRVKDLSFGIFFDSDVTNNLGGTDVVCEPQFPATRNTATDINGGTTNCVEVGQP
jgi:parallel beta helix pectate lyase-like protein